MKTLNVTALSLLVVIAVGIYTVPRFNYEVLVTRQTKLEGLLSTLQERINKIDWTSGPNEEGRRAALAVIETLPATFGEVRSRLGALSEEVAALHAGLDDQGSRLDRLEEAVQGGREQRQKPIGFTVESSNYTHPIQLPEELAKKAKRLSPRNISDKTLDDFLPALSEAGVIPLEGPPLTREATERLGQILDLFRINMDLIQTEQNLHIQEVAEKKTLAGDFIDLPNSVGPVVEEVLPGEAPIRFVRIMREAGVKRVFSFHLEEYPEMVAYNDLRDNARDHLVRDAALVVESLLKKN